MRMRMHVHVHLFTPPPPGVEHCISSDHILELEEFPKKLAVIGEWISISSISKAHNQAYDHVHIQSIFISSFSRSPL